MKLDDWTEARTIADRTRIQHYLNGKQLLDVTDTHPNLRLSASRITLQQHVGRPTWTEFQHLKGKTFQ